MPKKTKVEKIVPTGFTLPIINYRPTRRDYIILIVLGLLLLAFLKKDWFVAATVNGQPIATSEVNQKLNTLYKQQILDQLISEKVLQQEATKHNIVVTEAQVDEKLKNLEDQYGGADTLNAILAQQGMTREDLRSQTKIQLMVEALYGSEASPSAEEVEKFMNENQDSPEATEPAKFRELALEQTKQEKLRTIFSEKFQALKQAAKIQIF
jgi:foldase protein PrsA